MELLLAKELQRKVLRDVDWRTQNLNLHLWFKGWVFNKLNNFNTF